MTAHYFRHHLISSLLWNQTTKIRYTKHYYLYLMLKPYVVTGLSGCVLFSRKCHQSPTTVPRHNLFVGSCGFRIFAAASLRSFPPSISYNAYLMRLLPDLSLSIYSAVFCMKSMIYASKTKPPWFLSHDTLHCTPTVNLPIILSFRLAILHSLCFVSAYSSSSILIFSPSIMLYSYLFYFIYLVINVKKLPF